MNDLHVAAGSGSPERTIAVLSRGVDIDERSSERATALMYAAVKGHSRVVRILLSKGANMAIVNSLRATALHLSAIQGHLAVTKLLVEGCADLEAASADGCTPLHLAAEEGHSEVVGVLIEAGAHVNSRASDGSTSLYRAAQRGRVDAIKVLLRAKANPLLTLYSSWNSSGAMSAPLDVASTQGHPVVVGELIQGCGIKGCGGASGGVDALYWAARNQHLEVMGMLTSAGVVDTGFALQVATAFGRESSVKFLLHQQESRASGQGAGYVDTLTHFGATALACSIEACRPCSPRITRWLVDAGADTTTAVRIRNPFGERFNGTPLALVRSILRSKKVEGKDATENQLHSLEAMRRLLLRVEAVHAVSWLWASGVPFVAHAAAVEGTGGAAKATSTPLTLMLPVLRRRAERPRVLLAALFRHSRNTYKY